MIFTFQGQNTYIFDLDEKGKALVLNQGVIDLGEASSPECLAILRLEDNAVVMDIHATADNGEFRLVTEEDKRSYILDDGDTVEISGNQLHLSLHRNDDGDLLGGEFTLESSSGQNDQADVDEPSGEKSNSDTSDTGVKHKSGGLFETLIYSSQPDTPSKPAETVNPNPPVSSKKDDEEDLSETLVVDENLSETQVADENLSDTQVADENLSETQVADEDLSETRVSTGDLSETRVSPGDLSETRVSVEDLSETRISIDDLRDSKVGNGSEKAAGIDVPQDANGNASERLSGETSLIESTMFSVDVVNKQSQKKKNDSDSDKKIRLLKIGDGIKEDSSTGEYDYHVMKYVGQGGFGQVYKIEDKYKNPFALKVLLPKVLEKSDFALKLFDQEVGIARFLEYSGLVKALEHYYDSKRNLHYCIMTYIDGVSFTDVIDYYADRHTSMHYMYATLVVLKVAEVLDYLSEHGVVHRDIKPQNVMLTRDGEVKVLDLGISRRDFNTQPLADNEVLGTLPYVPLGQFLHQDPVDVRVDIYSLGVMYFGLLTCDHPYAIPSRKLPRAQRIEQLAKELLKSFERPALTPNPRDKNKNVPENVAKVVMKMMAQDVRRRYKTADDLIHDLERITGSLTVKEVKRELSNMCDAVKNKKPVPVPTAGLRNRGTVKSKTKWMKPLAWIAAIIVILGLAVMFVKNINDVPKGAFFDAYMSLDERKNDPKLDLSALDSELSILEGEEGILHQPSQMAQRLEACRENIKFIKDFEIDANNLLIMADSEKGKSKAAALWPKEHMITFSNIEKRFNNLIEKLNKRAEDAIKGMDNTTVELSRTIQGLTSVSSPMRPVMKRQLNDYVNNMETVKLCHEHLMQNNLLDEARLQNVTDQITGHENWQGWCDALWKVQDALANIDIQTADEVLKTAEEEIQALKEKQESFVGFKENFKSAWEQENKDLLQKKQALNIMREIDSQHSKIDSFVSELGDKMVSEEQLQAIRSICEDAEKKVKDNPELTNSLVSIKVKLEKMKGICLALETLNSASKRYGNAAQQCAAFKYQMPHLKDLEDKGNLEATRKELAAAKNLLTILEKSHDEDSKKFASMGENVFPKQVNELDEKWSGLIKDAQAIVENIQDVEKRLDEQNKKRDKAMLQEESVKLAVLANSVEEKVLTFVTWDWEPQRKEQEFEILRKAITSADTLLRNMERRETDNEEKKNNLLLAGKKDQETIEGIELEMEGILIPLLEKFHRIKTELETVSKKITDIETLENNGGELELENLEQQINGLERTNGRQSEPLANLKNGIPAKFKYLPDGVVENFKTFHEPLLKLQTVNQSRLSNQKKIIKDVMTFWEKLKALADKVKEFETLCNVVAYDKDFSKKNNVEYLYRLIGEMGAKLKAEVNQTKSKMGLGRIQAIDKELDKARKAWDECQKIFNQLAAFEREMDELKKLLEALKAETEKLRLNTGDFLKVEAAYMLFQAKLKNTVVVPGVIPGRKIEERNQVEAQGKEVYESYEKIKKENKKKYDAGKKEFRNLTGQLKELDGKLAKGQKVQAQELGRTYFDVKEKFTQLMGMPGDQEIKNDQARLAAEFSEAETLYRKLSESLKFLEYSDNYAALKSDLQKKKWGLPISDAKIHEKVKTIQQLTEELLRDQNLSPEKKQMLMENLREIQNLDKKQQP